MWQIVLGGLSTAGGSDPKMRHSRCVPITDDSALSATRLNFGDPRDESRDPKVAVRLVC